MELAKLINANLASRRIGQLGAAALLRVKQPKISALANYRLEGFSLEKLLEMLTLLNTDVEISIRPGTTKGRIHVSAA